MSSGSLLAGVDEKIREYETIKAVSSAQFGIKFSILANDNVTLIAPEQARAASERWKPFGIGFGRYNGRFSSVHNVSFSLSMFNEEKQCVYEEIDRCVSRYDDLKTTTGIFRWFLWALNSAEGLALGGSRVIDVYGLEDGWMLMTLLCEQDWQANAAVVHGISKPESTCPFMLIPW
ncbi:hypothetical protein ARMSODRAFT_980570 [Armillaria solidipes]|uniref:Uncharacterized protein n=1 Tax=Armillaria solidipes TaxID=1076256 RepID=A0A2H3B646_9AGAR|nr:hypothetical protein ARMSODRAFT_980570 [Armillaria solidipes]